MASYISVPRDLTKVKSKVMFNLTKRQLICFTVAALIGVPSFFLLKKIGSTSMAAMGMMVVMMPFFFLAMYERNGQPLEVYLDHFIQATFKRPKIRPYQTNNYYAALMRQAQAEKEVENIVGIYNEDVSQRGERTDPSRASDKGRTKSSKRDYQKSKNG